MEFNYCSCPSLLFLLVLSISYLSSSSIQQENAIREVNINNPVLHFTPQRLDGSSQIKGYRDVSCERVRIVGRSMINIKSFANVLRVNVTPSVAIPERLHSKIEVCFHRNASLGLCQCEEWRTIQKGQWSVSMSPYENRYVDVKLMNGTSGVITVAVGEDFQQWRLYFLVIGFVLLLVAPILSDWVPFYYTSSMAIGVLLVVLILLFQGMKLLPTGRKSAIYFTIYGSLVGLGSYIVHYFSMLISSILVSFGLSEEMYSPNPSLMHDLTDNNVLEEVPCLKGEMSSNSLEEAEESLPNEAIFSDPKLNLKRKSKVAETNAVIENEDYVLSENPKKKARVSGSTRRNKKKNQEIAKNEDVANNVETNGQSSSSCNSEDGSQEISGMKTSKGSESVDLCGKTRAGRGSATDPQSIYARKRREKINERLRILQNLVPNGTKVDIISTMLEEAVQYVKFLQVQIKVGCKEQFFLVD